MNVTMFEDASALSSSISGAFFEDGVHNENDQLGENSEEHSSNSSSDDFAPLKIIGRSNESDQLLAAFRAVILDQMPRVVAVHGISGMGKTSLIESALRHEVCEEHEGYFCMGKFFQNSNNAAHSALMAAFSDLCDLVIQSQGVDQEDRREEIRSSLGTEGFTLSNLISNVSHFLPLDEQDEHVANSRSTTTMDKTTLPRFKVACRSFLRAMSTEQHPIVLFLDDLQWADEGSKQLILALLKDSDIRNVLFVLAYRDEDAAATESVLETIEDLVDIRLGNLDDDAIKELLAYVLSSSFDQLGADVVELCKLVVVKTQGNPFHLRQFIAFIQEESLLTYHHETHSWDFDVGNIQQQTMIPDSLVDVLERRMDRLPHNVLETMMVAALLGYRFEERVLCDVVSKLEQPEQEPSVPQVVVIPDKIKEVLRLALREGLIEEATIKGQFLFSHDKLLSSFEARSLNHSDPIKIHLAIAECFIDLKGENGDQYSCQAAQHANKARVSFEQNSGPNVLAELNIEAADYCIQCHVFCTAADYLRMGVDLMDRDGTMWERDSELSLSIIEKLASVELVLGNFSACRELAKEMMEHSTCPETKANSMWFEISIKVAENRIVSSNKTARDALQELGVDFPVKVKAMGILRKLFRVRCLLGSKNVAGVLELPVLADTRKLAVHRFLIHIAVMALTESKEKYMIYASLMVVESSIADGLSTHTGSALALCAVAEASLGNYERAYQYGQLALAVASKINCLETESITATLVHIIVLHWKEPIRDLVDPLSSAFTGCFFVGNHWYAALAASNVLLASLASGVNLIEVGERARYYLARFNEYNQTRLANWILPFLQCILNLTSRFDHWNDAATLTGDAMDEKEYLAVCSRGDYATMTNSVLNLKLLLAYHFGCYDVAEATVVELASTAKVMRMHYICYMYHFYAGMTYFALSRRKKQKMNYFRMAVSHRRKLQKFRSIDCPNTEPLVQVLLAEQLSLNVPSHKEKYEASVELAVQSCTQSGLMQHTALVYERAGFTLAKTKNSEDAQPYFDRALAIYGPEWGSTAKYDWLNERCQAVLMDHTEGTSDVTIPTMIVANTEGTDAA